MPRALPSLMLGLALGVAPLAARAQPARPPWQPPGTPAPAARTPAAPTAPGPLDPRAPISRERYGAVPDPGFTHVFQMPTARPLRLGDSVVVGAGTLGWIGLRHSFTSRFDAGVGVPYYAAGVSADARVALWLGPNAAVSLWGFATVPVLPGDASNATAFAGFTWQGAGAAWAAGPVASLWNGRVAVNLGANVAQRVLLGGAWLLAHASVEVRVGDGVKWLAQGVILTELFPERGAGAMGTARALIGAVQPRVMPYALTGLRLHSRRFAIDVGVLFAIGQGTPLSAGVIGVWPWTAIAQYF